jgi:hypothetical protein
MRVAATTFASGLVLVGLLANPMLGTAAPCTTTGPGIVGNASTDDVTLGGADSDACHVYEGNAQSGPNGDTSGFDPAPFGTGWSLLAKVDSAGTVADAAGGPPLTLGFSQTNGTSGTWSLTSTTPLLIDLVFAMHAGGRTGAFLFDDELFAANVTKNGTWLIEWVNNGNQVPNYSNLTVFWRDERLPPQQVPEPGTLALLAAILVSIGSWRVRRPRS